MRATARAIGSAGLLSLAACGPNAKSASSAVDSASSTPVAAAAAPTAPATPDTGEVAALKASGGRVTRTGATLTISTTGAGSVALVNDSSDSAEEYRIYQYWGPVVGTPFHGVHLSLFESAAFLLVNDSTGRKIDLLAPPLVSPGGKYLAAASFDLEAQMSPNALTVYGRAADSAPVVYTLEPVEWGPDSLHWVSEDTLAFTKLVTTTRGPGDYDRVKAQLVRRGSKWVIVPTR